MNLLIDTNIFLEILLNQEKKELCKDFLQENIDNLSISDFSLHSIGVILLRNKKDKTFSKFLKDILPKISVLTLTKEKYIEILKFSKKYNLDFDDSYQACLSVDKNLEIITMDKDFKKIAGLINVRYIS
ncbi:MAG: PIN domain-containing protein [Bacteroidales bacterium]|nr:PIN domain-containing protein [Bacteroidales bacterium]